MWVQAASGEEVSLPAASVLRVLDYDFSQRQDRENNPHGEHAHDIYTIVGYVADGDVWGAAGRGAP